MAIAKMTSRGRVTIPSQIRKTLTLKAGDKVEFVKESGGRVFMFVKNRDVRELKACLPKPKKPVSLEEIQETIRQQGSDIW